MDYVKIFIPKTSSELPLTDKEETIMSFDAVRKYYEMNTETVSDMIKNDKFNKELSTKSADVNFNQKVYDSNITTTLKYVPMGDVYMDNEDTPSNYIDIGSIDKRYLLESQLDDTEMDRNLSQSQNSNIFNGNKVSHMQNRNGTKNLKQEITHKMNKSRPIKKKMRVPDVKVQ